LFARPTPLSVSVAALGIAGFIVALFLLSLALPGPVRARAGGSVGSRDRLSGLLVMGLVLSTALAVQLTSPRLALLTRHFWSLIIAANGLAWAGALLLFLTHSTPGRRRAADFFFGIVRHPVLCGLDLKMFSYRPSLLGLLVMNLAFAAEQWRRTGRLTLAMAFYQAFTLLYIANYFQFERGMRFTWDIIEERFGWTLVWGDYGFVPFFYCLPAMYVVGRTAPLPLRAALPFAALYAFGFWLFRGANGQKHRFKETPDAPIWGHPPRAIGGRLLASGFWGIGRKLNYTGELLMYLAWTLLAGFQSWVPYLLPLWLLGLLVQRAARDDRRCRAKYGALWEEYCRHARFRMFPFVY
jgi:Delta14-sterol reductase